MAVLIIMAMIIEFADTVNHRPTRVQGEIQVHNDSRISKGAVLLYYCQHSRSSNRLSFGRMYCGPGHSEAIALPGVSWANSPLLLQFSSPFGLRGMVSYYCDQ